jgi:hypothetical protein
VPSKDDDRRSHLRKWRNFAPLNILGLELSAPDVWLGIFAHAFLRQTAWVVGQRRRPWRSHPCRHLGDKLLEQAASNHGETKSTLKTMQRRAPTIAIPRELKRDIEGLALISDSAMEPDALPARETLPGSQLWPSYKADQRRRSTRISGRLSVGS